jgi:hypothetical protein
MPLYGTHMHTAKFPERIVFTGSEELDDNKLNSMIWILSW